MSKKQSRIIELRTKRSEKLCRAVDSLDYPDNTVLQVLSLIYDYTSINKLNKVLRALGMRDDGGRLISNASLKPIVDRLKSLGHVERSDQGTRCSPLIVEHVTRSIECAESLKAMIEAVREAVPAIENKWYTDDRRFLSYPSFVRELRLTAHENDAKAFLENYTQGGDEYPGPMGLDHPFPRIFGTPLDVDWLLTRAPEMGDHVAWHYGMGQVRRLENCDIILEYLQRRKEAVAAEDFPGFLGYLSFLLGLLRGDFRHLSVYLHPHIKAYLRWLEGYHDGTLERIDQGLKEYRKIIEKRAAFPWDIAGVFIILAYRQSGEPKRLADAARFVKKAIKESDNLLRPIYEVFKDGLDFQRGERDLDHQMSELTYAIPNAPPFARFFFFLEAYWLSPPWAAEFSGEARALREQAEHAGFGWLAYQLKGLEDRLYGNSARPPGETSRPFLLVDTLVTKEPWERALENLQSLGPDGGTGEKQMRLIWYLRQDMHFDEWHIQPMEQRMGARGRWTKGRKVSLKRLRAGAKRPDFLSPRDLAVCAHIMEDHDYGYYSYNPDHFMFDTGAALIELAGHPLVFWEDEPKVRIDVVEGNLELIVKRTGTGLEVTLHPEVPYTEVPHTEATCVVVQETPTRLKVVRVTEPHRKIVDIVRKGLHVPEAAQDSLLKAMAAVAPMVSIQSDIGGGGEHAEEVPADATPRLHLMPAGEGLNVEISVRPFGAAGSYYRPGQGGEVVMAEVEGKRLQTRRNLDEEGRNEEAVIAACPVLLQTPAVGDVRTIDDVTECLELLVQLQALEGNAVVEWPQGERFRVTREVSMGQFSMSIRKNKDWFGATGEVQIDEERVIDIKRLLELTEACSGRFVQLDDGQFLALTREFRRRLEELRAFSDPHGKGVRFHPLAAMALEDFTGDVGTLRSDKHWKAHFKRMEEAMARTDAPPSTLQAELRDYQVEGFQWLARLAHAGLGACLADDMGLGKTLQALAIIVSRAEKGPALAVAPTSVCMNWEDEARRFAPTLTPIRFGPGDRQAVLDNLKPFDLLITSYGLLHQESERLQKIEWQTIVLDEAQAIKNMATMRSKAAMGLKGGFKLITTGTPIENHLGELWNLFRFINAGLLGSHKRFNERFAMPIERDKDSQVRHKLKKLIQPFILRRLKSQVLEELPPRTDILLHVELNDEERALYEALRQRAVEKLAGKTPKAKAGEKHLRILAEIMKLRRACCNPRLVTDAPPPSSKLELFAEVLTELRDNGHKALVFSQFVDHLSILREHLDANAIPYQYLDGSTSVKERKKRIYAFQRGQGDVFLISLKAGGLGLNLTAADYVIHMDPWWNPAVEDQASDRAHRIGQQRPVTVYRLVAKDTIEEKIVALHHQKRDLADSLLEGSDMAGQMKADELLKLIQEG